MTEKEKKGREEVGWSEEWVEPTLASDVAFDPWIFPRIL